MNPGGADEMTASVQEGLQQFIQGGAEQAGMTADDVMEVVLVGNPVMHHLLLGIDPIELGGAPFALAVDTSTELRADEINLSFTKVAAFMSCHVLQAMWAQMPLALCWQKPHRHLIKSACSLMLAQMLKLFLVTKTECLQPHHQQAQPLRVRKSHQANAPRQVPLNASVLMLKHSSHVLQ